MLKFALAGALALGLSSAAFAETTITATLAAPIAKPVELLANDTLWTCVDKACVVKTKGADTDSLRGFAVYQTDSAKANREARPLRRG